MNRFTTKRRRELDRYFRAVVKALKPYDLQSVADAAGVSRQMLANWQNGKTETPNAGTLMAVGDVVGLPMQFVY